MSFYVESRRSRYAAMATLLALLALPTLLNAFDQGFYVSLLSRVLIYALAATSLNLVLGFGGMVSFGHAAFFGLGAYTTALLLQAGVTSAWLAWPTAIAASALAALLIGAVCLRTRGVYFIMITLAFAQMLYYLFVSMQGYGGDDGLPLAARNAMGFGFDAMIDLRDDATFYYIVLACLALTLWLVRQIVVSRFGRIIQGIRENETRMEAIGYPVLRYRLACFVIAGALAGLAGALLANQTQLAAPSQLFWTQSGMLLVMVVLGGVGTLHGGVLGAAALLLIEEVLAAYTGHSQLGVGLALLAVVFFAPRGLAGIMAPRHE